MVRYADPSRCPDCSTTLTPHPTACPTCGLPLTGAVVHELYATLQKADALMARLRATAVPSMVPPYDAAAVAAPPRARLGAPSVPRILLGLGVLCLLVAAVTFLAVAWSWLGVGGRTVVLLLLTATSGGLSVWLSRRDLRLAGESLAVIGFGLLVLDVVGADNAGWFGSLTTGGVVSLAGIVAGGVGVGVAVLQRSAREPMVTPQVAGALGLWAAAAGFAFRTDHSEALAAIAAVALLGLAVAARALGIPLLAALLAFAGASWWLLLVLLGAERALDHRTVSELVGGADAWPIVVAIGLLVGAALLERHHVGLAALALGAAGVLTVLLLLVPASDNGGAQLGLVVSGLLLAAAAAASFVARPWRHAVELPVALLVLVASGLASLPVAAAVDVVVTSAGQAWTTPWTGRPATPGYLDERHLQFLVLVPLTAALMLAALTWRRPPQQVPVAAQDLARPMIAGLLLAAAVVLIDTGRPLVATLALVAVSAGLLGWWAAPRTDRAAAVGLVGAAGLGAVALLVALPSVGLTAVTLALLVATSAWFLEGARPTGHDVAVRATCGVGLAATLAGLGWTLGELAGVPEAWRAAPTLLVLAGVALARPRPAFEVAAGLSGATVAAASVVGADDRSVALAAYLTLAGALVIGLALANDHRRYLGWLGGALLAAATWVRLWDLGIDVPEAYTLPSAVALLLVGLRHLARHEDAGTGTALTPGLLLATVPSLLVVLREDPVSLRAALLGLGCLVLVLGGAQQRWEAPLVVGASVGAVLVLRLAAPYAAAVPPWMLIAVAGAALLVVGVTWEARLRDLRGGADYLARLR